MLYFLDFPMLQSSFLKKIAAPFKGRPLPHHLHTWLADQLIAGFTPEQLTKPLLDLGYTEKEILAAAENILAETSFTSARKIQSVLGRRESLLKTLDLLYQHQDGYTEIKKTPLPDFQTFLKEYYYKNKPGHFTGGTEHWAARKWTPQNLIAKVGASTLVEIQTGRESDPDYEKNSLKHKQRVPFGDFVKRIEDTSSSNDFYLTANNQALGNNLFKNLTNDFSNIGDGYLDLTKTEGRQFLWTGPRGIITPLHHDLTNNIFIQIYGKKRFRLIPATEAPYLYNKTRVFSEVDLLHPDLTKYPLFKNINVLEIDVLPGDCVFIPVGWWHHVVGESASISLSFTNINTPLPNTMIDFPK